MENKELISKALGYISNLIDNNAIGYGYVRIKMKSHCDSENIEDLIYASEYSSINEDDIDHSDNLLYGFQQDNYNEEENGFITDNENYQSWKADIIEEIENELKILK